MEKIRFSFLFITYKQERFVEEAFLACVNQKGDDFEIVISDDCSPDNTYQLLEHLVVDYRNNGGNIPITLNRNEKNLGIGGNFQKAAELSRGEWLLMAAGDDVSLPCRLDSVRKIVKDYPNIYGISTARYFVDENGQNPRYNFKPDYLLGADAVWKRDVFTMFRPLDGRVMSEDHVLFLRALLLGGMVQVNTPTINYRISSQNYSIRHSKSIIESKQAEVKKINYHIELLRFRLDDLMDWEKKGHYTELMDKAKEKIEQEIEELIKQKESYNLFLDIAHGNLVKKLTYIFTPSQVWLHNNVFYRLYNLMKMSGVIDYKPKRKTDWQEGEVIQDYRTITMKDFVSQNQTTLF